MAGTKYIQLDDDVRFVLDQHIVLHIYSASSLNSPQIHYSDSVPTSLYSYSLMLRARVAQ